MLRTVVLALSCTFALSPSWAQTVMAAPDNLPAGPLLRNAASPLEDTASPDFQARQSWRRTMAQKPPPKPGCFTTNFPSTEWTEVTCSTAPALPHPPRLGPAAPSTGGGGASNDSPILSVPPSHPITSISGSLAQVSGVTSESDPTGAGRWSLQLNANQFEHPFLRGAGDLLGVATIHRRQSGRCAHPILAGWPHQSLPGDAGRLQGNLDILPRRSAETSSVWLLHQRQPNSGPPPTGARRSAGTSPYRNLLVRLAIVGI